MCILYVDIKRSTDFYKTSSQYLAFDQFKSIARRIATICSRIHQNFTGDGYVFTFLSPHRAAACAAALEREWNLYLAAEGFKAEEHSIRAFLTTGYVIPLTSSENAIYEGDYETLAINSPAIAVCERVLDALKTLLGDRCVGLFTEPSFLRLGPREIEVSELKTFYPSLDPRQNGATNERGEYFFTIPQDKLPTETPGAMGPLVVHRITNYRLNRNRPLSGDHILALIDRFMSGNHDLVALLEAEWDTLEHVDSTDVEFLRSRAYVARHLADRRRTVRPEQVAALFGKLFEIDGGESFEYTRDLYQAIAQGPKAHWEYLKGKLSILERLRKEYWREYLEVSLRCLDLIKESNPSGFAQEGDFSRILNGARSLTREFYEHLFSTKAGGCSSNAPTGFGNWNKQAAMELASHVSVVAADYWFDKGSMEKSWSALHESLSLDYRTFDHMSSLARQIVATTTAQRQLWQQIKGYVGAEDEGDRDYDIIYRSLPLWKTNSRSQRLDQHGEMELMGPEDISWRFGYVRLLTLLKEVEFRHAELAAGCDDMEVLKSESAGKSLSVRRHRISEAKTEIAETREGAVVFAEQLGQACMNRDRETRPILQRLLDLVPRTNFRKMVAGEGVFTFNNLLVSTELLALRYDKTSHENKDPILGEVDLLLRQVEDKWRTGDPRDPIGRYVFGKLLLLKARLLVRQFKEESNAVVKVDNLLAKAHDLWPTLPNIEYYRGYTHLAGWCQLCVKPIFSSSGRYLDTTPRPEVDQHRYRLFLSARSHFSKSIERREQKAYMAHYFIACMNRTQVDVDVDDCMRHCEAAHFERPDFEHADILKADIYLMRSRCQPDRVGDSLKAVEILDNYLARSGQNPLDMWAMQFLYGLFRISRNLVENLKSTEARQKYDAAAERLQKFYELWNSVVNQGAKAGDQIADMVDLVNKRQKERHMLEVELPWYFLQEYHLFRLPR